MMTSSGAYNDYDGHLKESEAPLRNDGRLTGTTCFLKTSTCKCQCARVSLSVCSRCRTNSRVPRRAGRHSGQHHGLCLQPQTLVLGAGPRCRAAEVSSGIRNQHCGHWRAQLLFWTLLLGLPTLLLLLRGESVYLFLPALIFFTAKSRHNLSSFER